MTTVVVRNKEAEQDVNHPFHRLCKSIDWPDGAIYASQEREDLPWEFRTTADVLAEKRCTMEQNLHRKREWDIVRRVSLYVWVFYVPGFFYNGWWTYLVGIEGHDYGGGRKSEANGYLLGEIMKLFPIKNFATLFPSEDDWMKGFAKQYQRGTRGGKPQGKAPVWAEVKGSQLVRILGKGEWSR